MTDSQTKAVYVSDTVGGKRLHWQENNRRIEHTEEEKKGSEGREEGDELNMMGKRYRKRRRAENNSEPETD